MTIGADQLDSFAALATALGLLRNGELNGAWFENPIGSSQSAERGLSTVVFDDEQRGALFDFVDEVLGPPGATDRDGVHWVPLFANPDPAVTVFVVVTELPGVVHLGVGVEHTAGSGAPSVLSRIHVPIFQLDRTGSPDPPAGAGLPDWLLLGRPGARIELTVDVVVSDAAPTPGEAHLGAVAITVGIPTTSDDELQLGVSLRDVQLPGATSPTSISLSASDVGELGAGLLELVTGLVRAQAAALDLDDPLFRGFAGITGMLGLREVDDLPALPLAELPTAGVAAIVGWIEQVLADGDARDAWLAQVGLLLGATPDAANDAVVFDVGPLDLRLGVSVAPGVGGHPVLTPWIELTYDVRGGVDLSLRADLLRADTATGNVKALPDLRAEAVFGALAGGSALLSGDPGIGSARVGLGLSDLGVPRFSLTLHDCRLAGRTHALLDLSTPDAVLDAANDAIDGALATALAGLGSGGAVVAGLIGLEPPASITGTNATDLLSDPLGTLRGYWDRLSVPTPTARAAAAELLGDLHSLVTGAAAASVSGIGTVADPWRLDLVGAAGLRIHRTGSLLTVELAAATVVPVLGDFSVSTTLALDLVTIDLAAGSTRFGAQATGRCSLHRTDSRPASLELGKVTIETRSLDAEARWSATSGFGVELAAPGLAVEIAQPSGPSGTRGPIRVDVPLPRFGADGVLTFAPDWEQIEAALAALLREVSSPAIDALVDLVGWDTRSDGRLGLGGLIADARVALDAWLAAVVMDCDLVRLVLGPFAAMLSGFRFTEPLGSGSDRAPYRCPLAGEPRAPGIAVWLEPGCPPSPLRIGLSLDRLAGGDSPPEPADIVRLCADAAASLADVADLLVSRPGLAQGIGTLTDRWHLTDGLVAAPSVVPDDITAVTFEGFGYDELVALAAVGALASDLLDPLPTALIHVTSEQWTPADWPGVTIVDARGNAPAEPLPAAADGVWLVILPTPVAAAAARPDRGGVGEQAARLAALLSARTAPVALIGYGDAGAAAIRTANEMAVVEAVATVGTPWAGLSVESLRSGLSADALHFLERLSRPTPNEWSTQLLASETTPFERMRRVVDRSAAVAGGAELPSALGEARRAGVTYVAAFGSLTADAALVGLAALVADGLEHRYEVALAASGGANGDVVHTALHAAVDLPVIDLNLAGLLVGAGARLELLSLGRDGAGGLTISTTRTVHVDVHLGVHDGWLVGGPGAGPTDFAARWASARISIPLDDSAAAGTTEFVLHEASAFGVFRERWVVTADGVDTAATALVPEVRTLLGQIVGRVASASSGLADLLTVFGLYRNSGLDPTGLDRLFHDPATTIRDVLGVSANVGTLAAALRQLLGVAGDTSSVTWTVGGATATVDLANRSATLAVGVAAAEGSLAVTAAVAFGGGSGAASLTLGSLDPHAGGLVLVASAGLEPASRFVRVDWQAAGTAVVRSVGLAPVADVAGLTALATTVVPATVARAGLAWLRATLDEAATDPLDGLLDSLGLLGAPRSDGHRGLVLPLGLFTDPLGWLRSGASAWRADPVAGMIVLLDTLAAFITPGRGATPGWPIAPGLTVGYRGVDGRLELTAILELDTVVDGRAVTTGVVAGLSIGASGAPLVVLDAGVALDGRGVRVSIAPTLRVELTRPPPTPPIALYPAAGSIGSIVAGVGGMVLPPLIDALRSRRTDAIASMSRDVAAALHELVVALDLLDPTSGATSGDRLLSFAADPAAWTVARLPALAASGLAQLANALDPSGTIVAVVPSAPGSTKLGFGAARAITVQFEAGAVPAITLAAAVGIPGVGRVAVDQLRVSAAGLQVAGSVGPLVLDVGGAIVRPLVTFRAGVGSATFTRMLGVGLALDEFATRSVEVRWGLDAQPPVLTSVSRPETGESIGSTVQAGLDLLSVAVSLATGIALDALGPVLTARALEGLQGVVFADVVGSTDIDPTFFVDLLDPAALLDRAKRLAWNLAATNALSVTIDATVTIALVADDLGGGRKRLGVGVSLAAGKRFAFPTTGDVQVELEVDASWVDPVQPPGLNVFVLEGAVVGGVVDLELQPSLVVAGVGLRFTKTSGALLDLGGIAIDGIGLSLYGEVAEELGGGVRVLLEGLAFAPSAGGGTNPVANSIMNDAGTAGAANRPAFSPSIAVQRHPGSDLSFSVRAGTPPGPWWVMVQRQLGPLYVDRVGFDSAESNGTITRITLLFDGSVSLFGLTAAVDQLSLSWLGGDLFDISSWSVDLMGLAVSADMTGVSLSGGLLKTVDNGVTSYVGMLLGRFGVYGLSVFGGYADDRGTPSFFVFGAINGPIGGPPAFFLTGLGGGLGINRGLIVPDDLSRFGEYPFIKALDPAATASDDPMGELRMLTEYFPPQTGNFWFAAGISFTSFALVDGVAVVAVSFGEGLEINLLGLARMALPRPQVALVSIELALRARFSTIEGVFMIQAQLTDNSWLLYEEVRLTGGFAFALWWKGPLAGQFVLTIGGYHPDFHRDGYPEVPRLGLTWRVTDDISIKGGAYFALTSEALMAGVDVEVTADFGWAWARLAFGAHGIVYFDPFWFEVRAYVRISAGVEIETWLGDISFSISLGAHVRVWGPEFSGEATIEVGPCEFGVGFGSGRQIEGETLDWTAFVAKYLEQGAGGARALSSITGRGTLPAATGGATGAPSSDGSSSRPFEVFAEFELSIVTTVPVSAIELPGGGTIPVLVKTSAGATAKLGISPMRVRDVASVLRVVLERFDELNEVWVPMASSLSRLAANLRAAAPTPNGSRSGTDAYPIGAWGTAAPANLTDRALPTGDVLFAGNRLTLVAEAATMTVGPEIDFYRVESGRRPLPLRATGTARGSMRLVADAVNVFAPVSVAASLGAAETLLFTARTDQRPDGVLATGERSRVERAAFAGQRSAPPLFGSLFDGLDVANGDDGAAVRNDPAPATVPPIARDPFVAGFLAAGVGAVQRHEATTVADRRLARRRAPSLESVEGRLGRQLPVRLATTALPASAKRAEQTLVAPAAHLVPRTAAAGATASFAGGPLGHRHLNGVVSGLSSGQLDPRPRAASRTRAAAVRAEDPSTIVRSGDIVVLQSPDAMIDTATAASGRPSLRIKGSARVTVLGADGSAMSDALVTDGDLRLPAGYAVVAAQADAIDPQGGAADRDGMSGWHARGRVVQIGTHAAIAPGAVVTIDGAPLGTGAVAWRDAGELTHGAAVVTTRFAGPITALVVALGECEVARLDGLELQLRGARIAADARGKSRDPIVVHLGTTVVLVYEIEPDEPGAAGEATAPTVVRVRSGAAWTVVGVLGTAGDAAGIARRLARNGLAPLATKLLATAGPGAAFTWRPPSNRTAANPTRGGRNGRR